MFCAKKVTKLPDLTVPDKGCPAKAQGYNNGQVLGKGCLAKTNGQTRMDRYQANDAQ